MIIETKYNIGQVVYVRLMRDPLNEVEAMVTAIWYDGKFTRYEIVFNNGKITVPESSIVR